MKYLTVNNVLGLLLITIVVNSCININAKKKNEDLSLKEDTTEILSAEIRDSSFDLKYLQGIWKSYSYYLEHEEEDKDEHINEYYKIITNNNCLDIVFKDHFIDDMILKTYVIGFTDNEKFSNGNAEKVSLNSKGNFLIRLHKKNYFQNIIDDNDIDDFEISENYSKDIDMYMKFEDGFRYSFLENDEKETVQFRKINALPHDVFCKIKEVSSVNGVDFIKEFNVKEISKQVKVIKPKVYFYSEMNENTRRKAFLIQDDLAYLEAIEGEWVKVYYDGKVVTSGYVKMKDIQIVD